MGVGILRTFVFLRRDDSDPAGVGVFWARVVDPDPTKYLGS